MNVNPVGWSCLKHYQWSPSNHRCLNINLTHLKKTSSLDSKARAMISHSFLTWSYPSLDLKYLTFSAQISWRPEADHWSIISFILKPSSHSPPFFFFVCFRWALLSSMSWALPDAGWNPPGYPHQLICYIMVMIDSKGNWCSPLLPQWCSEA